MGIDHGHLFQKQDRQRMRSDQINYDYFEGRDEDELASLETGFSKPLRHVFPRLELLGFSMESVKQDYERAARDSREQNEQMLDWHLPRKFADFASFVTFTRNFKLNDLSSTISSDGCDEAKKRIRERFGNRELIEHLPFFDPVDDDPYSEITYFVSLFSFLDPYSTLRLLAENDANLDVPVTWHYGPLVNSGWESEEAFKPCARRDETFLIATEGSSDAHILQHALDLLKPDIADFFRFIDMSESHPFPGTGNLHKFAKGLSQIDVHNQLVLLYDNDAEGRAMFTRSCALKLPDNMRIAVLPDLEALSTFPTIGPGGIHTMNINQRAAAIECYLDLEGEKTPDALVRWRNLIKDTNTYQGSLENKRLFMKAFLDLRPNTFEASKYDTSKIFCVLEMLVGVCISIAEDIGKHP